VNFTLLFIPPLLIGVFLLRRGLRGRRVDDHPICRRCGFDLFGRPEGSEVCAECGVDLARPRAIQDGRRERRRGLMAVGAVFLAIALTMAGAAGYASYLAADMQSRKPAWWLARELDSADHAVAVAAAKEFSVRVGAGTLSQRYIDVAADKLLKIQSDPRAKWDAAFGNSVEDARLAGKLSDPRFHQYVVNAPAYQLVVRPRINRGDGLPFSLREGRDRVGSRQTINVTYKTTSRIDGIDLAQGGFESSGRLSSTGGGATGTMVSLAKIYDKLADGPHKAEMILNLSFRMANAPPGSPPMCWTKTVLAAPFDILPADAPTVTIVRDPKLAPAIDKAISITDLTPATWNKDAFDLSIHIQNAPVDLGFEVFVRGGGGGVERRVTSFAVEAKPNSNVGYISNVTLPGFAGDRVDFILRSSVDAAKKTTDVFSIWEGEIVKGNVRVKPRPGTSATSSPATTTTTK